MSAPTYPGHAVQLGETDADIVTLVQRRLVERGCGPLEVTGAFDNKTRAALRLFQGRFPDGTGVPLVVDGKVGSLTWEALFGDATVVTVSEAPAGLLAAVLKTAGAEVGVMEHWRRAEQAGIRRVPAADATADPAQVHPGMIFVLDTGGGAGHTGLVEAIDGGRLITLEGNTNDGGSREGVGVFRRNGRKIVNINRGFIRWQECS